ncbi:MAG: hypothetical protein FWD21_01575 [Peptococcaceae bacterium]|nr:hypothetical protein [Peptococcaceae bacterium]
MANDEKFRISLDKNPSIVAEVVPGHFTTGYYHANYYLDVSKLKASALVARDVARELAIPYIARTTVETIVCMDNTEVIGAYLAEELLEHGALIINSGGEIHVVTPMGSSLGKFVFQDSVLDWLYERDIVLLTATISSGRTVNSALECISYYGGNVVGISTLFMTSHDWTERAVHPLFTVEDIPGFKQFLPADCEICKSGQSLDAIISSEGYTKIGSR